MKKLIKYTVFCLIILFLAQEIYILSDGFSDDPVLEQDVIVVLGSKVNEDGSVSPRLQARLDKAFDLFQKHQTNMLFVSGGIGKEGHPEGDAMRRYLINRGIPQDKIIVDNQGNTTRHTALNFKEHFPPFTGVVLVSQYFHITRCKLAFRQTGFTDVRGCHAMFFEVRDIYSSVREVAGIWKYYLWY